MNLTTTTHKEICNKANDKLWDISIAYALDREKIRNWLQWHAEQALGGGLNRALAVEKYQTLGNEIRRLSDTDEMGISEKTMQDAKDGVFQHKAPSVSTIWFFWFIILVITGGFEQALFSYLVFYKGAGWMLITLAVLLLAGGLIAGHGTEKIMMQSKESEYGISKDKIEGKYIGWLVIGIILIAGITAFRWVTGGIFAGITAAFFGLVITTAEASFEYHLTLRKFYLRLMFKAQQLYSATQIKKELRKLGNPEDFIDDSFREDYVAIIDSITRTVNDTTASG